ncbi:hypothetical protein KIPB_005622 [Kipferlia bialata]|uniref:Phospholipid/glycerol acyltransferase domain-containing protein n=1 Tax=Kipferlia bialata TaxID=797122 RepID=A0A9K3GIM7_9EUKA|nr:hypothetical protein KIPB_005622 [Kipferlia bialata]|eukprot:g5622.t1
MAEAVESRNREVEASVEPLTPVPETVTVPRCAVPKHVREANKTNGIPNPFATLHNTHKPVQFWQILKIVFIPLQLLRFAVILLDLMIACPLSKIVLFGCDLEKGGPPTGFRGFVFRSLARKMARLYLFMMGYWNIKHVNRHNEDKTASLIVSNHVSGADAVLLMSQLVPAFVAKSEVRDWLFFGTLATALRSLFVERKVDKKVPGAMTGTEAIANRVQNAKPSDPPLVIFPEGTTTNQTGVLPFKSGAFRAGVPCQPIVLRYFWAFTDQSDACRDTILCGIRLCREFFNRVEIEWLPMYHPSQEEKENPTLYAENVRTLIATSMGVEKVPFSFTDKQVYLGKKPLSAGCPQWLESFGEARKYPDNILDSLFGFI